MVNFKRFLAESEKSEFKKSKKQKFELESSIDYPASQGLCQDVWQLDQTGKYVIRQDVKAKLQSIVNLMPAYLRDDVHVIGSICSNLYKDDTDIDLHFVVDGKNIPVEKVNDINKIIRTAPELVIHVEKDKLKIGTHPIELYLQMNQYQDMASVGCYDFNNDTWLAGPEIMPMDYDPLQEYAGIMPLVHKWGNMTTEALSNLRMMIVDYCTMLQAKSPVAKDKIMKQQSKIIDQMKVVSDIRDQLGVLRKNASQPKNANDAAAMRQSKEWNNANALFKFLQRYKFIDVSNVIKQEYDQMMEDNQFNTHIGVVKSILHV